MFFDKLWVRIKGDLLIMKDDLATGENLRERAAILLERLEDLLTNKESGGGEGTQKGAHAEKSAQYKLETGTPVAPEDRNHAALENLRHDWEELLKQREERHEDSKDSEIPPPNPRKLG